MAIPFRAPKPAFRFRTSHEIEALDALFEKRAVPKRSDDRLLLASWNIANLGAQKRSNGALGLCAHILKQFELIAVQEVNEKFRTFAKIVHKMGPDFDFIMSDTAGNDERLAYIYDKRKVRPMQMFGELALREREFPKRTVSVRFRDGGVDKVDKIPMRFTPFDRNPFIGTFAAGEIGFTLVNAHLYFGKFQNSKKKEDRKRYARRVMEIFALARWADRRANRKASYDRDIILLGDMNVPSMDPSESTYEALVEFGFKPLEYVTKTAGSNLGNDKTYDQMVFAPGTIDRRIKEFGVFDFDNAVFGGLWDKLLDDMTKSKAIKKFNAHVKYHISDHRPVWTSLDIS